MFLDFFREFIEFNKSSSPNNNGDYLQDVEQSSSYNTYDLLSLEELDEVTWPCALRLYLQRSKSAATFTGDYYTLPVEKRVEILLYLTRHVHGEFSLKDA